MLVCNGMHAVCGCGVHAGGVHGVKEAMQKLSSHADFTWTEHEIHVTPLLGFHCLFKEALQAGARSTASRFGVTRMLFLL